MCVYILYRIVSFTKKISVNWTAFSKFSRWTLSPQLIVWGIPKLMFQNFSSLPTGHLKGTVSLSLTNHMQLSLVASEFSHHELGFGCFSQKRRRKEMEDVINIQQCLFKIYGSLSWSYLNLPTQQLWCNTSPTDVWSFAPS